MNRRSFFKTLATAAAGFAILPSATTYARTAWKRADDLWVPNPEYLNAPYEVAWMWTGPSGLENASRYAGVIFNRGEGLEAPYGLKFLGDDSVRIREPLPIRYRSPLPGAEPIPPYIAFKRRY